MSDSSPELYADQRGIWSRRERGTGSGIAWDEIYILSGYKLDGITEVYTVLTLDWEFGEYFEFDHTSPGFQQVVDALTTRLRGIDPDWFQKIQRLSPGDPPLVVWQRQGIKSECGHE